MKTDTLARRLRFSPPAPRDTDNIFPQPADLEQWAAISRHGPLPLSYLFHFGSRKSYQRLQKRYTRFFHHGWVTRPPRQFESFHARYSPLVYDLAAKAIAALEARACSVPPQRTASFVHQLMQGCITASLEVQAQAEGLAFLGRDQLLGDRTLGVDLPGSRLIPDDLFALRRPDGKRRFFILEADRNTESIERTSRGYNTWKKKLADYDQLFTGDRLQRAWGIPKATVLIVTTNATHADNLRTYIEQNSRHAARFAYAVAETFALNWRVPKDLLPILEQI